MGASAISNKEDEYDDIGNSIAQVIGNFPDTDEYFVINVTFGDDGEPDVHASIKED